MNLKKYKISLLGFPKTLRFSFHCFPFKTAFKLPVWLSPKVRLKSLERKVILDTKPIKRGMISIGFTHVSINDVNEYSLWNVEGTVIFKVRAGFGAGSKIAVGKDATPYFWEKFFNYSSIRDCVF